VLPVFATDVYVLTAALFIAGISFAPTMVVVMKMGTIIIPPSRITEGLTWMTTGISVGVALGGMLAGMVIDAFGARAGFAVAIGAGLMMVVVVLAGLRTLAAASAVQVEPAI
jgi:MFS family permease